MSSASQDVTPQPTLLYFGVTSTSEFPLDVAPIFSSFLAGEMRFSVHNSFRRFEVMLKEKTWTMCHHPSSFRTTTINLPLSMIGVLYSTCHISIQTIYYKISISTTVNLSVVATLVFRTLARTMISSCARQILCMRSWIYVRTIWLSSATATINKLPIFQSSIR